MSGEAFATTLGFLDHFLALAAAWVWGLPLVTLIVGSGVILSFRLGFPQFYGFAHAVRVIRGDFDNPDHPGHISHFQALCTALSATLGLGNISGVAVAIHLGGPGATFWMMVSGFFGMALKYAEVSLSLLYRRVEGGHVRGGPMYYIVDGLGTRYRPVAVFFAIACIAGSYGAANMFQTNQVAAIFAQSFQVPPAATGFVLAILTGLVILGGIRRIARVTAYLVPFMAVTYVLGGLAVMALHWDRIPEVFFRIFQDAFAGTAAAGGFAGIAVREVVVQGIRRGSFSNEAGLGSSPIAHSAVATDEPVREGVVALLEPFLDTVVICSMTAFVIVVSGDWQNPALSGVALTARAFETSLPGFGRYFVPIAVLLFAYATLLSWSYYGERATDFLVGEKGVRPYRIVFCVLAFVGALWEIMPVLNFSDIMMALMAIPNLVAIWLLYPRFKAAHDDYFERLGRDSQASAVKFRTSRG